MVGAMDDRWEEVSRQEEGDIAWRCLPPVFPWYNGALASFYLVRGTVVVIGNDDAESRPIDVGV
jgi:hypothetical protein